MEYQKVCANAQCKKSLNGGRMVFIAKRIDKLTCCDACSVAYNTQKKIEKRAMELMQIAQTKQRQLSI